MAFFFGIIRWVVSLAIILPLTVVLGFLAAYLYVGPRLPEVSTLRHVQLQMPMRVYTYDGALIAEFGEKRRVPVRYEQLPPLLVQALLATEDQRFYEHSGVDLLSLMRVSWRLMKTGQKNQGASTITMQVARNFFLSSERTFQRKINEIFLAWNIETQLTKTQILELYLNKIAFGHRAYGIGAAAHVYYGKTLEQLDLGEIAVLVGIPKGPSIYNPLSNPEKALERRNYVLQRMLEKSVIDQASYQRVLREPLTARYHDPIVDLPAPYVAEMVRREMIAKYGEDAAYSNGYRVYSTARKDAQKVATDVLRQGLLIYDRRHGFRGVERHDVTARELASVPIIGGLMPALIQEISANGLAVLLKNGKQLSLSSDHLWPGWTRPSTRLKKGDLIRVMQNADGAWQLAQIPEVTGALVSLDPNDGAVLALTGGFDFQLSQFNRAVQAERQAGSNIKPFLYSAALDKSYTPASIINDAPISIYDPGSKTYWTPQNANNQFRGPMRLREALRSSTNMVSVRILLAIGVPYAVEYLQKFGFPKERIPPVRSLSLGVNSVTPMELVRAYAMFANGGYRVEPYVIDHITDPQGKMVYQAQPKRVCRLCEEEAVDEDEETTEEVEAEEETGTSEESAPRTIEARNAYMIHTMLQDVIRAGTAHKAAQLKRADLAGKTGTTNDFRDAWFSGYNADIVTTVWVGFDDHTKSLGKGEWGSTAALPIWMNFMGAQLANKPNTEYPRPAGLVATRINPYTGRIVEGEPSGSLVEWFRVEDVEEPERWVSEVPEEPIEIDEDDTITEDNLSIKEDDPEPIF